MNDVELRGVLSRIEQHLARLVDQRQVDADSLERLLSKPSPELPDGWRLEPEGLYDPGNNLRWVPVEALSGCGTWRDANEDPVWPRVGLDRAVELARLEAERAAEEDDTDPDTGAYQCIDSGDLDEPPVRKGEVIEEVETHEQRQVIKYANGTQQTLPTGWRFSHLSQELFDDDGCVRWYQGTWYSTEPPKECSLWDAILCAEEEATIPEPPVRKDPRPMAMTVHLSPYLMRMLVEAGLKLGHRDRIGEQLVTGYRRAMQAGTLIGATDAKPVDPHELSKIVQAARRWARVLAAWHAVDAAHRGGGQMADDDVESELCKLLHRYPTERKAALHFKREAQDALRSLYTWHRYPGAVPPEGETVLVTRRPVGGGRSLLALARWRPLRTGAGEWLHPYVERPVEDVVAWRPLPGGDAEVVP